MPSSTREQALCSTILAVSLSIPVCRCSNGDWPNRSLFLTLGKLVVDVAKLVLYVVYFVVLFTNYGMPLIMVCLINARIFLPGLFPCHTMLMQSYICRLRSEILFERLLM